MPRFNHIELLQGLQKDVSETIAKVKEYQMLDSEILNKQPQRDKWSVAQVLEHLNSYNQYYLPELEKSLKRGKKVNIEVFKSGWFGNYFTKIMQPDSNGVITKQMKSPQDHSPQANLDSTKVISRFINGQEHLLSLLKDAEQKDIGKLKTPISISKYIKLKTGDTFRFLIAHQQRHMIQAKNVISDIL